MNTRDIFSKNPTIAKFFREIGRADELGSGVRKINDPVEDNDEDREVREVLEFCRTPRSAKEIQELVGIHSITYFRRKILNPLIKGGLVKLTLPDKPTSPKQKYYS